MIMQVIGFNKLIVVIMGKAQEGLPVDTESSNGVIKESLYEGSGCGAVGSNGHGKWGR
jgi:hypothetical protein